MSIPASNHSLKMAGNPASSYFWISRDRSQFLRAVGGSVSFLVPHDRQMDILSSGFEDWCYDNLTQGVLAEWLGLDLYLHFASKSDRMLTVLRWR